jgi:hypothetical protein
VPAVKMPYSPTSAWWTAPSPPAAQNHGFMYGRSYDDPDGHSWQIFWMAREVAEVGPERYSARTDRRRASRELQRRRAPSQSYVTAHLVDSRFVTCRMLMAPGRHRVLAEDCAGVHERAAIDSVTTPSWFRRSGQS